MKNLFGDVVAPEFCTAHVRRADIRVVIVLSVGAMYASLVHVSETVPARDCLYDVSAALPGVFPRPIWGATQAAISARVFDVGDGAILVSGDFHFDVVPLQVFGEVDAFGHGVACSCFGGKRGRSWGLRCAQLATSTCGAPGVGGLLYIRPDLPKK